MNLSTASDPRSPARAAQATTARPSRLRVLALAAGSLAAGAVTGLGYPPGWLGVGALLGVAAALWLWSRADRPLWAAVCGLAFGAGLFGTVLAWSRGFGLVAYLPFAGFQALFFIPVAMVVARTAIVRGSARPGRWVAATVGIWVLVEAVRTHWPWGGFEWGLLGYVAHDLPLRHAAAVGGTLAVTGLLLWLAAGAVAAAGGRGRSRLVPLASGLVAVAVLTVVGLWQWTSPSGELTVAVVQTDPVCPEDFSVDCPFEREGRLARFGAGTSDLQTTPDVILWGEGAIRDDPQHAGAHAAEAAGGLPAPLLAGVVADAGSGEFWNGNVLYDPDGELVASYAKRHPVPFGEFVPARRWLGGIGDVGRLVPRDMVRGTQPGRIPLAGVTVGTVTSWEVTFARDMRDAARQGDAVIVLTAKSSYGRSVVSDQVLAKARMRAVESQKPVVMAAITGQSTVVRADGQPGRVTRLFAADLLEDVVELRAGTTPYAWWGDAPVVALALVGLVLAVWRPSRRQGAV